MKRPLCMLLAFIALGTSMNPLDFSADVTTAGIVTSGAVTEQSTPLMTAANTPTTHSSYDALNSKGRRRSVAPRVLSEEQVLDSNKRERLFASGMDLWRNWVLFQWVMRRHLDYNTLFDFHACNDDPGLNRDLEFLMERDSRKGACDIGARHNWNRFRRLSEVQAYVAGDCGLLTLSSGHLQGVESHTIRNPMRFRSRGDRKRWVNGVKLGRGRRAVAYNLREFDDRGRPVDREIRASRMWLHGKFEARFNQVRGVSPIPGSLNNHRDIYEIMEDTRAKIKAEKNVHAVFTRAATAPADDEAAFGVGVPTLDQMPGFGGTTASEETSASGVDVKEIDFSQSQAFNFTDDPGVDVNFKTADLPGAQTQQFLKLCISIAIKALDLPMNFFDEAHTNYFGSRAAWILYERSCDSKRADQLELHRLYTLWRLRRWILPAPIGTGEFVLPSGMMMRDLKWKWIPRGVPWWKPSEELDAELRACLAGADSLNRVSRAHGLGDPRDNIRENTELVRFAQDLGFPITWAKNGQPLPQIRTGADDA